MNRGNPLSLAVSLGILVAALGATAFIHPFLSMALCSVASGLVLWFVVGRVTHSQRSQGPAEQGLKTALENSPVLSRVVTSSIAKQQDEDLSWQASIRLLEYQLELLAEVLDALESSVLVIDASGKIIRSNSSTSRLLDRDRSTIEGSHLEFLFSEQAIRSLWEQGRQTPAGPEHIRMVRGREVRVYECVCTPIEIQSEALSILIMTDQTELVRVSDARTDFVGSASHELRTPIASIRAAVETLLGPARDDPGMRERLVELVHEQVLRLEELLRDLLDLTRIESPGQIESFERIDLVSLCREVEHMLDPMGESKKVSMQFEISESVRTIWSSARTLRIVLRNLVDNAIKFSREGGEVRVVAASGDANGKTLSLKIIDRGIGIPIEQQPRIFERFYQVDASRTGSVRTRGTGLGLAIVKHALRRIGGSVEVHSVWNEGTTMVVTIPLSDPEAVLEDQSEPPPRL